VVNPLAAGLGLFHLAVSPQDFGMMRRDLDGHDDAANLALRERVDDPHKQTTEQAALMAGCAGYARQGNSFQL
jgi:hypothetical protein